MRAGSGRVRYLQRQDPEGEITLYINSPGGSVDSGMALYDVMQAVSCPIRTVCVGLAASMAALLFVSGAERDMLPHSRLMIHVGSPFFSPQIPVLGEPALQWTV